MKNFIKTMFLILLICGIVFLSACGESTTDGENPDSGLSDNPDTEVNQTENGSEADDYMFPAPDFGGDKFIILNNEPIWDFTTFIVPEEQTGDILNDAVWGRNITVGERFNIELEELAADIHDIPRRVRNAVQSQSQEFDAVFCSGSIGGATIGSLVVQNYLVDLTGVPELNLNSPWWNQKALEDAKIGSGSAIYFASNDISIHALQCPWVIYFNIEMLNDLGLDAPYQLVRDGKWTLDQMETYMKAAVSLNADESFSPFRDTGTSIYGLSTAIPAIGELLRGSDVRFVSSNSENMPVFTADEPRFIQAAQKLADILSADGMHTNGGNTHYEIVFMNGRSLFCYAELKAGTVYRESETAFGIVPTPKLDENQGNYVHNLTQEAPVFIIPESTPNTEKTALVIDALAYYSTKDVTPVFFGVTMSQKELRDEESVEMLQIIRDTAIFDIGRIYNWSNQLNMDVYNDIVRGGGRLVSIIEGHAEKINAAIEDTIAEFQ
ncbi:MAG: hypothetical protein FWH24_00940 [Oscillospiraceae bacterium]|nr:hypothetical protein [Oscillospiraceae bacterium]